ncbi:MAG: helix-turn-helix domain-containing protein [Heliobacteriaceae bacterium]|jgi:DNA-binding response OmpR family regulator|nr:helix-turn-helix domain-containing protein [Heliobacteriaceae bacterium]
MSEYLSKEEVKQWRSSLEKITLEEYAARLGKKIEQIKPTKDIVDIVLQGNPVSPDRVQLHTERLDTIADRAMSREKEISSASFNKSANLPKTEKAKVKAENLREEVRIAFKKALTEREQRVFDHLLQNNGKIVYAKDLAALLDLPRDYIYKYIKNLRTKIEGDNLKNADKSGFVLTVS